jgi:Ca2+-binding EF-hand superfamily protein
MPVPAVNGGSVSASSSNRPESAKLPRGGGNPTESSNATSGGKSSESSSSAPAGKKSKIVRIGPPPPQPGVYVARQKLRVRQGYELDSVEVDPLPADTHLRILDQRVLPDSGVRRAWVSLEKDERTPYGWITTVAKDGSDSIKLEGAGLPTDDDHLFSDDDDVDDEEAAQGSVSVPTAQTPPTASPAAAAAGSAASVPSVPKAVRTPAAASTRAAAATTQSGESQASSSSAQSLSAPSAACQELHTIARAYLDMVAAEAELLDEKYKTLRTRIGEALAATQAKVKELVVSWAKDGHQPISKMDFRKHVRRVIKEDDTKKIDELFGELDDDGSGSLDVKELTATFNSLQDEAKLAKARAEAIRQRCAFLQSRAGAATLAADTMAAAEEALVELNRIKGSKTLGNTVGEALITKNFKVGEIVGQWDSTKGEVSKPQFRKNLAKSLDVKAPAEQVDRLFDRFDKDSGGTLDLDELKAAMEILNEEHKQRENALAVQQAKHESLAKTAKSMHADVKKMYQADQDEAKQKAEAEAKEAKQRALAEANAQAARDAAKEAAETKKAAEKAEFERKVEERRIAKAVTHAAAALPTAPPSRGVRNR